MKHPLLKILTLIGVALIIYAATVFYLDWRIPRATATVQVHPTLSPFSGAGLRPRPYMESQYETAISNETLVIATQLLGIQENHQRAALLLMKKNVEEKPVRGTDFIAITAKYPDHDEAVRVANAVAEAYLQRRTSVENSRTNTALKALDDEVDRQQNEVTVYQNDLKVSGPGQDPISHALKQETYEQARALLREMKIKQKEVRVLLKMPHQPITIHQRAK